MNEDKINVRGHHPTNRMVRAALKPSERDGMVSDHDWNYLILTLISLGCFQFKMQEV
jgi:hypothetical protein